MFSARSSALCLFGLVALSACRPIFHRQVSGRVLALEGTARGMIEGKTIALTSAAFVRPGETITSSETTRLDLMLLPGVLVEIAGDAEIEISQLRLERDGDETIHPMIAREAGVRLRRGTLIASVGRAQTDSSLLVETPAGTLVAGPECIFKVVISDNKAMVLCVRGAVGVQAAGAKKDWGIRAGYFVPLPLTAAGPQAVALAGAEVQAEVRALFDVQKHLLHLEREHGSAFEPWCKNSSSLPKKTYSLAD